MEREHVIPISFFGAGNSLRRAPMIAGRRAPALAGCPSAIFELSATLTLPTEERSEIFRKG